MVRRRTTFLREIDDKELLNRIRGHGNFVEQVPIALVLLLLNDLNGLSDTAMYSLGGVLLVSRIVHYLMITTRSLPMVLRPLSMIGTLGTILVSAFLLVFGQSAIPPIYTQQRIIKGQISARVWL